MAGNPAWPYVSLVLVAVDHDLSPILLLSDLAEHSKAIAADPRVSLLFDGTGGLAQPLTGTRVSLLGRAAEAHDERLKRRFLARHPDAAMYAGFKDFHFYKVTPERAHLVAGFGKIRWIEAAELLAIPPLPELAESEEGIVSHMNRGPLGRGSALCRQAVGAAWFGLDHDRHRCGRNRSQAGRAGCPVGFRNPVGRGGPSPQDALVSLVAKAREG